MEEGDSPAYDDERYAAIVREALGKFHKSGPKQAYIAASLNDFIQQNTERYGLAPIRDLNQREISDFIRDDPDQIKKSDFRRAIWLWMHANKAARPFIVARLDKLNREAQGVGSLPEALHFFLNEDAPRRDDILASLSGKFKLYRPYFDNPERIMVAELTCGLGGDPSRFQIEMGHTWPRGEPETDRVNGYIVPCENQILFQGRLEGWGGSFILVMRHERHSEPVLNRAEGVLLAAASTYPPSAYPVLMVRSADVQIGLYDMEEFSRDTRREIEIIKGRGVVDWR